MQHRRGRSTEVADDRQPVITGLDGDERALLIAGLTTLRFERGRAWLAACRRAVEHGRAEPPLENCEIEAIVSLARRLGGNAPHWNE